MNIKYFGKSDGTRDTKQSPELESKKSSEKQVTELCNFLRIAFCVDEVLLTNKKSIFILGNDKKDMPTSTVFEARSEDRGIFYISFTNKLIIN